MTITLSPWPVMIPLSLLVLYVVAREVVRWKVRTYLGVARIATDLERLAEVRATTVIRVVGFDLSCLISDEYEAWRNVIRKWTDAGATIIYLIHECTQEQLASLRENRGDFDPHGHLHIQKINRDQAPARLVEQTRERHWTLFQRPAQLWTESRHPVGDNEATGCLFVRPGWLDFRYFRLSAMFDRMARGSIEMN